MALPTTRGDREYAKFADGSGGETVVQVKLVDGSIDTVNVALTADTSKVVTHNYGYYPIVQIIDGSGNMLDGEVQHSSMNAFTVTFAVAVTGTIIYR